MKLIGNVEREDYAIKELRHFKNSIIFSIDGLKTSYSGERSLKLHTFFSILVIILGIICHISVYEWILSIILMGNILCIELLNTAIESCVDLVTTKKHPLARRAKDIASASAFMMSMFAVLGELMIFMPYFVNMFK